MTIIKKIFKIQFILVAFLAGYLLTGCGGGGSSGGPGGINPELNCTTGNSADCDGDGLISSCDADDSDATINKPSTSCDVEGHNGSTGDGYSDIPCSYYKLNDDGTLDNKATTDKVESYSRNACDNCPTTYNPDQTDVDNDLIGDECDRVTCLNGDDDLDNVCNGTDTCPDNYNSGLDADGDGYDDVCDDAIDADGDGYNIKDTDSNKVDCDDTNKDVYPGSIIAESIGSPDYNCDGEGAVVEDNAVFVDVANSVSGDGTYASPYNNIAAAVAAAAGTKDIYFYKGNANLDVALGSGVITWTIDQPLHFYGGVTCVENNQTVDPYACTSSSHLVRNSADKTVFPGIYVNVKSSAILDGFEFQGTGIMGYPVVTLSPNGGSTTPTLQNSIISGGDNYMGVDLHASQGTITPTIKNNVITASYMGIYANGSATRTVKPIIEDNEIKATGGYLDSFGIYFKDGGSSILNINRNKITVTNIDPNHTYGIYAEDILSDGKTSIINIYNNIIDAAYSQLRYTSGASVINNTFVIAGSSNNSGLIVTFTDGTKVINNLFYLESGNTSLTYGIISNGHTTTLDDQFNYNTLSNLLDENYVPLSTSTDIIDKGSATDTSDIGNFDFGGDTRVYGGAIDIGAQELQQAVGGVVDGLSSASGSSK